MALLLSVSKKTTTKNQRMKTLQIEGFPVIPAASHGRGPGVALAASPYFRRGKGLDRTVWRASFEDLPSFDQVVPGLQLW